MEKLFVLDLETTTDIEKANQTRKELLFEEDATFICATMYAEIGETCNNIITGYGKENAENMILNLQGGIYYTWNGARFDMHFIYHLLRKHGYIKQENTKDYSSKKKQLKKYEFSYLLSGGRLITLKFRNEHGTIELKDACLLFSTSLANFIKNTCPEHPKLIGTYDYKKYRVSENDFTDIEKLYCESDIKGFAIGMHRIRKDFQNDFGMDILDSYTAGSFAMKFAKTKIEDIENLFPKVVFPREYVAGGRTYLNPYYANKIVEGITTVDANSFYPSIMVNTKLPCGKQTRENMNSNQLREYLKSNTNKYVFAKLINGVIQYDDMYSPITSLDEIGGRIYPNLAGASDNIYLDDNILRDEKLIHENCIFECRIFEGKIGIFEYMKDVFHLKNVYKLQEKYGLELTVKIILNASYGKFIQRDLVKEFDFFDGIIAETGSKTQLKGWYLYPPMGSAITANCRYELTKYMNELGNRFIYCDTDSLTFIGEPPKTIKLGLELGEWKEENNPIGVRSDGKKIPTSGQAIFFQRKTYAKELNEEVEITFCGISNNSIQERYPTGVSITQLQQDMKAGINFNVLQANKTKNGIVLIERARMKNIQECNCIAFTSMI